MIPLDQWEETRGHTVMEYGRWDNDNLYCRCSCGRVGLRTGNPQLEVCWREHITDQIKLRERLK